MSRAARLPSALLALLAVGASGLLLACGSSDGGGSASAPVSEPQPIATSQEFPRSTGRTLPQVIANMPSGPVLAPSVSLLTKGHNRIGFALFDNAGKQIVDAGVALYIGK